MRWTWLLLLPVSAAALAPFDFVDPEFERYFELTRDQVRALLLNVANHTRDQSALLEKVNALNRSIGEVSAAPNPDAAQLGAAYQAIESLCRQQEAPVRALYRRQLEVLNEGQRELLRKLDAETRIDQAVYEAQSLFLVRPSTLFAETFGSVFNGTPFRPPFGGLLRPADTFGEGFVSLAVHLNLTPDQEARLRDNLLPYQEFYEDRSSIFQALPREIEAELANESPAAQRAGALYARIEQTRRELAVREAELRRQQAAVLTPEQVSRLESLSISPQRYRLSSTAQSLHLLSPPERWRPASRASGVDFVIRDPLGGVDRFAIVAGTLTSVGSIYRTCIEGPNYQIEEAGTQQQGAR